MGVLKFDAETNEFILTKTAGFLAGGLAEAKEFLSELILKNMDLSISTGFLAAIVFGFTFWTYFDWKRQCTLAKEAALDVEKLNNNTMRRMPTSKAGDGSVECGFCRNNKANVVLSPCNHLFYCEICYSRTKVSIANKITTQALTCPVCRQAIDDRQSFFLVTNIFLEFRSEHF